MPRNARSLLGVKYETIPIEDAVDAFTKTLAPAFAGKRADTTEENIQSRIRGVILMAISNKFGPMVLTTGNKSEMSVGLRHALWRYVRRLQCAEGCLQDRSLPPRALAQSGNIRQTRWAPRAA